MKDHDGDTITLTRAEYEALQERIEDAEDTAAYWEAKAKGGEGLPDIYMGRLIEGEAPLLVFREWRGLNQSELARLSGVHRVSIADIEAGRKTGSVHTLKKLAEALNITIVDLV